MAVFSSSSPSKEISPTPPGISILASGAKIIGKVVSEGVLKIEGTVEGSVRSNGEVFVGRSGLIQGDVRAREAVVGGRVHGSVSTEVRLEMQPGSAVNGDVATPKLTVQEGGEINGKIMMSKQARVMMGSDGPVSAEPQQAQASSQQNHPAQRNRKKNRAAV